MSGEEEGLATLRGPDAPLREWIPEEGVENADTNNNAPRKRGGIDGRCLPALSTWPREKNKHIARKPPIAILAPFCLLPSSC